MSSVRQCSVPAWLRYFSLFRVIDRPVDDSEIQPRLYLMSAQQVLIITQLLTWSITLVGYSDIIAEHPLRKITGSIQQTMAWNYPPCSFIAIILLSSCVYFVWRYAWTARTAMVLEAGSNQLPWQTRFAYNANLLLALSSNVFLCIFLLGPASNGSVHAVSLSAPLTRLDVTAWSSHMFVWGLTVVAWYLVCVGSWVQHRYGSAFSRAQVSPGFTLYVATYSAVILYFLGVYSYTFARFEVGQPPVLPWYVTQVADVLQLACFLLTPLMIPNGPKLLVRTKLAAEGEGEMWHIGLPEAPTDGSPSLRQFSLLNSCLGHKGSYAIAIATLLSQPLEFRYIHPRVYLAAAQEVFTLTVVGTYALSLLFFREQVSSHRHRHRQARGDVVRVYAFAFACACAFRVRVRTRGLRV